MFTKIVNVLFAYVVVRFLDFFFVEGFLKPLIANWGRRTFDRLLPPYINLPMILFYLY
jgi:hypothetical protein